MSSELLTVQAVAQRAHLSVPTVRRLCRAGKLGAFKVGGAWRIPASVVTPPAARQ